MHWQHNQYPLARLWDLGEDTSDELENIERPDDSVTYVENRNELRTISASGGPPELISMTVPDGAFLESPQFLPGGNALIFTLGRYSGGERIAVGSLESGIVHVLTEGTAASVGGSKLPLTHLQGRPGSLRAHCVRHR